MKAKKGIRFLCQVLIGIYLTAGFPPAVTYADTNAIPLSGTLLNAEDQKEDAAGNSSESATPASDTDLNSESADNTNAAEGTSEEEASKEGSAEKGTAEKETAEEGTSKEGNSEEGTAREEASAEGNTEKEASAEGNAEEEASAEGTAEQTAGSSDASSEETGAASPDHSENTDESGNSGRPGEESETKGTGRDTEKAAEETADADADSAQESAQESPREDAGESSNTINATIEEAGETDSITSSPMMSGSQEILAEKIKGSQVAAGDSIVIVAGASGSAISTKPSGTRIAGADVTIQETSRREVITELSENAAIFKVVDTGDGEIALQCDEGYLTSAPSGNGLFYSAEIEDCSKWEIQEDIFLYNPYVVYSSGGNDKRNQYLEFYNSNFTTYGKNADSNTSPFTMGFFRMGNSDPEDVIPEKEDYYLPVFETSDIHGYLADTSGDDPLYLLAYISDKVNDARGGQKDRVLLLDSGDIYQGNTLSNLFYGHPLSAAFQIMEYDAVSIGNHEFDWGIENTVDSDGTMMDYTVGDISGVNSVPVIMSNMYHNGEKITFADDYIILEKTAVNKDGDTLPVKIAVIGYAGEYSSSIMYNMFTGAGYTIDPDYAKVNSLASSLKQKNLCDAVVLLAHHEATEVGEGLGEGSDVDLVLGGHTHQNVKGQTDWGLTYLEPEGYAASYVYTELAFGVENGSPVFKKAVESKTVPVKNDTSLLTNTADNADQLDPELVDLTDEVIDELADILTSEIGYITESALRDTYLADSGNRSTTCGNWMSTIMARAVGAEAAFVNSGGIRTEVLVEEGKDKRYITLSDVYTLFPFGNKIYCYELTYEEFLQLLEYSLTDKGKTLVSQMAGIYCYYTDETVNAIVTKDGQEVYANGEWKDDWKDKKIRVASNEYVCTSNRTSSNGMDNPLYLWNSSSRLISNELIDNEAAITVLSDEAAENDGHLIVDTNAYFINKAYVSEEEPDEQQEDSGQDSTLDEDKEEDNQQTKEQEETPQQEDNSQKTDDSQSVDNSGTDSSKTDTPAAATDKIDDSDQSGQGTAKDSSDKADKNSSSKNKNKNSKSKTGNKSPHTGDDSHVLFWFVLMNAAGAAALTVWIIKRRTSRKH